ncbi:hypothetical protein VOLCADRAFT_98897 [Volvox carteri f. nagariensis]|uniref:Uncharacterized protein n=1 Tax=Volvox carteri f. nagariensis TaxID=3068 RepID=D8UGJ6_VOLCA|nr:uncharacterized protein VOLCADRAFT_98897 [Volvox carteri f. nagariensis]EFJ41109.1 hypothetical protein VOLCADRAFT_98897 [Volvox carteri f. nagariensis]|eukprot:XP_002957781.1 hypothetical protein VOLCADRAFT_98897 [Volvox carteri f. nagariensis]
MLQAVANADLERLARLASVMDNCATSLAVLCKVVSAACPEEVKTVQYIRQVHAEDGQEARSAMRDVAAAAMFDIIRRHVPHGSALAFPLRECVALPSARANEILQGTPAAYSREKHVPCGITAMEFMRGSVLGIVVQADADVFVVGAVSAAAGAHMAAQFLEGLAHRVEVVQDSLLLTERTVSALYVIPPGCADAGRRLRVQVCLRPYFSTYHVLNSFDLCACKVAALPTGAIVAHPRFVYGCARGRVQLVLPCHRQPATGARVAKYWVRGWLCEAIDEADEGVLHPPAGASESSMGGNVVVVRPTACSTTDLLQVALPLMTSWEAASDAEWRVGKVAIFSSFSASLFWSRHLVMSYSLRSQGRDPGNTSRTQTNEHGNSISAAKPDPANDVNMHNRLDDNDNNKFAITRQGKQAPRDHG